MNLKRDSLWAKYSRPETSVAASLPAKELYEMCQLSSASPLVDADGRLKDLFARDSSVVVNWASVFFSMKQDPLYSHSMTFAPENRSLTVYLFRYIADDLFFMFEVENGHMKASKILNRVVFSRNNERISKATRVFVNWLLHWIWHNI
mmetsp:Transcript_19198/g.55891  ORF Transcript_19198/g.55891 Transcript_19198/m.55891 type:complete len:148 (+) Transcript_19198:7770-8213(+)